MALNKLYVQTQIASADPEDHKSSVRFATTDVLPSYNRVGDVITATANGALPNHDNVTPAQDDDMLLWHGAADADNGIYTVTQLGDGSNPFILTRRDDANTDQFVTAGMRVPVEEGALYEGQTFVLMTPNPITLNTTGLTFEPMEPLVGASPIVIDGAAEAVSDSRRMVYADDVQIEDDGDLLLEGDTLPTTSFDNHTIDKVPSRQTRTVHEHEVMFMSPGLVVDGELVVDGQLEDFPEVPVSASNVLDALDDVLNVQELLGKTNPVGGVAVSTVNDWVNAIKNNTYVTHATTGNVAGYAFVDGGGDTAPWLRAEVAFVDASDEGLIIRGFYVDTEDEGFVASKVIVNTSPYAVIGFVDEEADAAADPTEAYRIVHSDQYGRNFVLGPKEGCRVVYDSVLSRWVLSGSTANPKEGSGYLSPGTYYNTYPSGSSVQSLHQWIVADYLRLYCPYGNATIEGFLSRWREPALGVEFEVRLIKFLVNTDSSYGNSITLVNEGSPTESGDAIRTNTGDDIVLEPFEMAVIVYLQGYWYAAKVAGFHAASHENGGVDEISVAGLSGLLADNQNPATHASSHENGGGDEISVAGLSGLLADDQNPVAHASDHENGGGDEISVAGLSGLLADDQNPVAHATSHEDGGSDEISVAGLSGVLADAQTPTAHDFGGSAHTADTLADVNTKVSDATLFGSAYGEMYLDGNSTATSVSQTPAFTKVAGTYSAGELSGFSHATGTLTYTGSLTKVFKVIASITAEAAGADNYEFRVVKNSTVIAKSKGRSYMSGSNDLDVDTITCLVSLETSDTIEIHVTGDGATPPNITVTDMNVNIVAAS